MCYEFMQQSASDRNDVTWTLRYINFLTMRLFVQQFLQNNNEENIGISDKHRTSNVESVSISWRYHIYIIYIIIHYNKRLHLTSHQLCVQLCLQSMMTSSNGNIFRVTGPLCGEFTGPGEFPTQRPVTRNVDVFFDLRLNKRLSKQPWGWWFETPYWLLWRNVDVDKLFSNAYFRDFHFRWRTDATL